MIKMVSFFVHTQRLPVYICLNRLSNTHIKGIFLNVLIKVMIKLMVLFSVTLSEIDRKVNKHLKYIYIHSELINNSSNQNDGFTKYVTLF